MATIDSAKGVGSLPSLKEFLTHYRSLKEKCAGPNHKATDEKISRCIECKFTNYCSTKCQKDDWLNHKHVCKLLKAGPERESEFIARMASISSENRIPNKVWANGTVYVMTNELRHDQTLEAIGKMDPVGNLLIGTSALCNLNLASVRPSVDHVLILDASFKVKEFWGCVSIIIRASTSRQECLDMLVKHLNSYFISNYVEEGSTETSYAAYLQKRFIQTLSLKESFLSDDDRYNQIKKMFESGHVVCLKVDILDFSFCLEVKSHLEAMALKADTIYLSNISGCFLQDQFLDYAKSLDLLMGPDTIIVDIEDQPFKLIEEHSYIYQDFHLDELVIDNCTYSDEKFKRIELLQRARKRGRKPVAELFPLIKLKLDNISPEFFYYEYGLRQGFYSRSEATKVSRYVEETISSDEEELEDMTPQAIRNYMLETMYEGFNKLKIDRAK